MAFILTMTNRRRQRVGERKAATAAEYAKGCAVHESSGTCDLGSVEGRE